MTTINEPDVVDLLLEQHNQIEDLFGKVTASTGSTKQELFHELVRLLAVHESAEELVVHPAARRTIDGGDQVVQARLHRAPRRPVAEAHSPT